jgi:hypothetical protein
MAKFKVSKYGQWEYPGQPTAVPTEDGRITMQGVPYPVMGFVPGQPPVIMQPGGNYQFPGKMVYEIPMAYGGDISIPDLSRPNRLDKAQKGKQVKYYDDPLKFKKANRAYQDSLSLYNQYPAPDQYSNKRAPSWEELETEFNNNRSNNTFRNNTLAKSGKIYFPSIQNDQFAIDQKEKSGIAPIYLAPDPNISSLYTYLYKKPTQKPVYKEKPKVEPIPYREARLEMSNMGLMPITYMPPSNTAAVLSKIKEEDMYNQAPKVVPAPDFRYGGWLDQYQGDEGSSQVQRRDLNQPFFESQTQPGTYEAQYSQPEISISPNWTEEELKRNQLRDKYIADDKKAFRHWYDKLGYDKDNVTKRANQFAYNKLAKQYLRGDKENLTPEQTKFIEKSEYANRLQPSVGSRFATGFGDLINTPTSSPKLNLETLANLAAPFEYPTNLVRGAVKGEFTDALKGQTPSPYFVSSDLAGTSPTEAAIASGLMDFGVDSGIGAIDVASSLNKGIRGAKLVANQADKVIYPTRAYRAEGLTQKAANARKAMFNSEQSKIYDQLVRKGDKMATKSLDEFQQYLVGNKGRAGLLNNEDMLVTEYKVPFWKKPVTENKEFVDFKEKVQRLDPNKNEYIIPGRTAIDRFLYPRRTNVIKGAPKNLTDDFIEGSYPLSYHSSEFLLPGYKYIEDQIGAVTGHDVPLFRSDFNTSHPRFDWKQPEFAPREGAGKFTRFNRISSPPKDVKSVISTNSLGDPTINRITGPGPLMLGLSKFTHEVKNPVYFQKMLDSYSTNKLSNQSKQYFQGIIKSVEKQGGLATRKQYDILQRLRTGDFNYGKKEYGGWLDKY